MSASQYNVRHEPLLSQICNVSRQRRVTRRIAFGVLIWTTLVLLLLSTACAPLPPAPCEPQPTTPLPAPPRSLPTQSWSESAAKKLSDWQAILTIGQAQ